MTCAQDPEALAAARRILANVTRKYGDVQLVARSLLAAAETRAAVVEECAQAAQTAVGTFSRDDYVLTGPGGLASHMVAAIRALATQPAPPAQHSDTCSYAIYGPPALCTCGTGEGR